MNKEDALKLREHADAIGQILRKNDFESIKTFEEAELLLRDRIVGIINPAILESFFAADESARETRSK